MASTLQYAISISQRSDNQVYNAITQSVSVTIGSTFQADDITVAQATSDAVPLGAVTAPTVAYFYNADTTNFYTVYDNATFLAKVRPGRTVMLGLAGTETLKVQADTADCSGYYFLAEEA